MLNKITEDLKERFLKFETPFGLFLILTGIAGIYITFTYLQFVLHAMAVIIFGSAIIYGLYALFHNPIKKAVENEILKANHIKRNHIATSPAVEPSPQSSTVLPINGSPTSK